MALASEESASSSNARAEEHEVCAAVCRFGLASEILQRSERPRLERTVECVKLHLRDEFEEVFREHRSSTMLVQVLADGTPMTITKKYDICVGLFRSRVLEF